MIDSLALSATGVVLACEIKQFLTEYSDEKEDIIREIEGDE